MATSNRWAWSTSAPTRCDSWSTRAPSSRRRSSTRRCCAAWAGKSAPPAGSARTASGPRWRPSLASRPSPGYWASRTCGRSPRPLAGMPPTAPSSSPAASGRWEQDSGPFGPARAELAANGIMMGFRSPDGLAGDLGGGSLELIEVEGEALRRSATLPLGGLRLLDASNDKIERAIDIADDEIGRVPWIDDGRNRVFYAVGGTWRAIARLHMEKTGYPLHVMHGYTMATEEAIEFCEEIRKAKKLSGLPGIEEISRPRREVLPYGALVLELTAAAGTERRRLLGVRHPRGPGLQPDVGNRAPQGPAAVVHAEYARARRGPRTTPSSCATGAMPCSSRPAPGTEEERRLRRRLPALRHQLARAPRLPRRAEPDPDRARGAGRHRSPGRVFLALASFVPPHRHQRRRGGRGQGHAVRAPEGHRIEKALQARPHRRG